MMQLVIGQKGKVADIIGSSCFDITVKLNMPEAALDVSCFGVDQQGMLSDDRYFVFYNQLSTPEGAIKKSSSVDVFSINLDLLPEKINRLILTAAIDGSQTMSQLKESSVQFGNNKAAFMFVGKQFQQEKAVILSEIYKNNGEWRMAIVAKGFNGGLNALLAHFGGEEIQEEQEEAVVPPKPVSLTKPEKICKAVEMQAPHLVSLTKKAIVSLEKKKLADIKAQVVLVLDVSGSMYQQYKKGRVQRILDKTIPLALLFDDNGTLDSWAFGTKFRQLTNATLDNIQNYIDTVDGGWTSWGVGGTNNEPPVMEAIYLKYKNSKIPVYILFISDGGVRKNKKIQEIIKTSAYAPLFWQFLGIHGSNYGALEKLDELKGRYVDNANFFALDDIDSISDETLYDRLMHEFPTWLKAVKEKQML